MSGKACFVAFVFGAGIGSAVTFVITKDRITKREQKIADDKIKSMKEHVDELRVRDTAGELAKNLEYVGGSKSSTDSGSKSSGANDTGDTGNGGTRYAYTSPGKIITKRDKETGDQVVVGAEAVKSTNKPDYTAYYRKAVPSEDPADREHPSDDDENEEVNQKEMTSYALNEEANSPSRGKPRVISYEEYNDPDYDHHSKPELVWYIEDETLADEMDRAIYEPTELIGAEGLKALKEDDSDMVYVRNPSLGADYSIQRVQYPFSDV